MTLFISILFAGLAAYGVMLAWLARGFVRTERYQPPRAHDDLPVTIIVCARNEEKYISLCLNSIVSQKYDPDRLQIIFINDASSDSTLEQAEKILERSGLDFLIVSNATQQGKKRSIAAVMSSVRHELIITRDADTFTRSDSWLRTISAFCRERSPDMVIAPVALADYFGMLWALQAIENNILAMATAGSAYYKAPFLCNGANLVFTRTAFEKAGAYRSHLHVASGDDVLFLEALKENGTAKIEYLKSAEATVHTFPCFSLAGLLRQKIRWASKLSVNRNILNRALALLTFVVNLGWLFCLVNGFENPVDNTPALMFVVCKLLIDILLLFLATGFIRNRFLLWFALPVGCVYPLYTCVVALSSLLVKPKWK